MYAGRRDGRAGDAVRGVAALPATGPPAQYDRTAALYTTDDVPFRTPMSRPTRRWVWERHPPRQGRLGARSVGRDVGWQDRQLVGRREYGSTPGGRHGFRRLQSLTGEKSDKLRGNSLFRFFNQTRGLGGAGYRPGEKVAIKLNSNQDRPGAAHGRGNADPASSSTRFCDQLVTVAGVPGQDITFYDASRYVGDPILTRSGPTGIRISRPQIHGEPENGGETAGWRLFRTSLTRSRFSKPGVPTAYPPYCVTEATYVINVALARAHGLMGVTQTAKNLFGSVYFEGPASLPQPLHDFASRDLPMGSYNCLVDLLAYKHLGGKTLLYVVDFL